MFCTSGIAARATTNPAARATNSKEGFNSALRDDFNLHLLYADVVGNVFGRHREPIAAGNQFAGHSNLTGAC